MAAVWIPVSVAQSFGPIAGCTEGSFVQGGSNTTIATSGASYTPKCLRIKVGSQVSIEASNRHPLMAMPNIDGYENPLASFGEVFRTTTVQFNEPGVYGYFCTRHGDEEGDGMAGLIEVTQ